MPAVILWKGEGGGGRAGKFCTRWRRLLVISMLHSHLCRLLLRRLLLLVAYLRLGMYE